LDDVVSATSPIAPGPRRRTKAKYAARLRWNLKPSSSKETRELDRRWTILAEAEDVGPTRTRGVILVAGRVLQKAGAR
jgi:hypothetical protein